MRGVLQIYVYKERARARIYKGGKFRLVNRARARVKIIAYIYIYALAEQRRRCRRRRRRRQEKESSGRAYH